MDIIQSIKKECLRRRLSPRTSQTYCFCADKFFKKCRKEPRKITKKDIINFLDDLAEKGKSGSTINLYLNSIKFFLEEVLHRNLHLKIRYSKRPKTLPVFLTKDETKRLIDAIKNPKHKLMISLMYSAGLRVSELLNLKVKDLELEYDYGWVRKGKGNKDRVFIIAKSIKNDLIDHIKELDKDSYIFQGNNKTSIHPRTVQEIIKKAAKKTNIRKNIHPHTLRHSFATHLIEDKCALATVQSILGHSSIETTNIYIHMAPKKLLSITSPLDTIR